MHRVFVIGYFEVVQRLEGENVLRAGRLVVLKGKAISVNGYRLCRITAVTSYIRLKVCKLCDELH